MAAEGAKVRTTTAKGNECKGYEQRMHTHLLFDSAISHPRDLLVKIKVLGLERIAYRLIVRLC